METTRSRGASKGPCGLAHTGIRYQIVVCGLLGEREDTFLLPSVEYVTSSLRSSAGSRLGIACFYPETGFAYVRVDT